jgi:hypothetical protein
MQQINIKIVNINQVLLIVKENDLNTQIEGCKIQFKKKQHNLHALKKFTLRSKVETGTEPQTS